MNDKIIVTSDIHGNLCIINKLKEIANHYNVNKILICGDILPKGTFKYFEKENMHIYTSIFGIPPNLLSSNKNEVFRKMIMIGLFPDHVFKNINMNEILSFLLKDLSDFTVYIIQGNDDNINVDAWKQVIEKFSNVIDINKISLQIFDNYQLIGFNEILLTPWNTKFEVDEKSMALKLNSISKIINPNRKLIFATHGPPFGYGDILHNNFHVGSRALMRFIKKYKPVYHFFGHIHENFGIYQMDNTVGANVSCLWNMYGWENNSTNIQSQISQFRAIMLNISTRKCTPIIENIADDDVNNIINRKFAQKYYDMVINYDKTL